MPVTALHAEVTRIALGAAGHGFALGGGNALLAYGLISRPTRDVDLFTDQEHGVQAAAGAVEAPLRDAGFAAERRDQAAGLADVFPGLGEGLAEWVVTASDGAQMMLQMASSTVAASQSSWTSALSLTWKTWPAGRCVRLLDASSPEITPTPPRPAQLLGFARRLDPGLEGRDFADAGQRLDQLSDRAFAAIGLGREDVAIIRQQFTAWPRTAEAAGRALEAEPPGSAPRGYPQLRADCDEAQEDPITSSSTDASREDPEAGR